MVKTKENVNVTIDPEIMDKFREYCRQNDWKVSTKLESMMRREMGIGYVKRK